MLSCGPCVKSPLCSAERGRSICKPACDGSVSISGVFFASDISGDGNNGEEFGALEAGFVGVSG